MRIDILTLFPGMFDALVSHSMVKRAIERKLVEIRIHDLRDYTHDRHRSCDDRPFGGGPGMLMKPEPVFEALEHLLGRKRRDPKTRIVYLSPQGKPWSQRSAERFAKLKRLVLLCGHYEGVDERVIGAWKMQEVSIGDYVLTGGELPAMVLADTVTRLLPGVLGREESKEFESFSRNLLEYPQYTRPAVYKGLKVPSVLLSGNHNAIAEWRQKAAYQRTLKRRPDLLKQHQKKE